MKHFILILLLGACAFANAQQSERVWTDDQGRNTKAVLLRIEDKSAILQLPDGREAPFPVEKLSKVDRAFIEKFIQEKQEAKAESSERINNFSEQWPDRVRFEGDPEIKTVEENEDEKSFIYESANYRYNSDVRLSNSVVKGFAVMFETTHQFVRELPLSVNGGRKHEGKYSIILMETEAAYYEAGGPPGSAGVYIFDENIVMVPLTSLGVQKVGEGYMLDRDKSSKTLPHELVHQLTPHPYYAHGSGGWFTEGLAEYIAVTPYYRSGMYNVKMNSRYFTEYVTAYGKENTGGRALGENIRVGPLKEFMLQSYSSFTSNASLNYGSALLITNYFFHMDRKEDGARIKKFLQALNEGKEGEQALEVLLDGQTWLELEKDIAKAYSSKRIDLIFSK